MSIKPQDLLSRARSLLGLDPYNEENTPDQMMEVLARHHRKNHHLIADIYYYLMQYYKMKYEEKQAEETPSVARDCVMTEYKRQKGIEI